MPAKTPTSQTLTPPSKEAIQAYRLRWLGARTQQAIAECLTHELGRRISQGQVSRWLKPAQRFVEAGGILPALPGMTTKPTPIDPERLDLGRRQRRNVERQRDRRDNDDDEE